MRVKIMSVPLAAAIFALLLGLFASTSVALAAPPWPPGGGTVDPKDPNHWTNPKDGPNGSDYIWDAKLCRWVYKNAGQDKLGRHAAGDLEGQGPPTGSKMNPGSVDKATEVKTGGDTFTWDEDKPPPGKPNDPPVPGSGDGWVNDKTRMKLCPPGPAAVRMPPGGVKQMPTWNFYGGLGGTLFINNATMNFAGTGTGNGASVTDNSVNVMPTVQAYAKYTPPSWGGMYVGIDTNLRIPTSGYQSSNFTTSNGINGTAKVKNGLVFDAMARFGAPNGMLGYGEWIPGSTFIQAGVSVQRFSASVSAPSVGDDFHLSHTYVRPAIGAGLWIPSQSRFWGNAPMGTGFVLEGDYYFPSGTTTMPGGSGVSYGTFKADGNFALLGKVVVPLGSLSDIRLKRDIVRIGRLDNGLGIYRFRYLWSDIVYTGVMAQEARLVAPDAVMKGADGYLRVDYARLGMRMMPWREPARGEE